MQCSWEQLHFSWNTWCTMLISCTVLCECVCQCMMMTFDAADCCTVVAAILSIGLHATIVACLLREHGLGNSMSQLHKKLCESSTWRTRFDRQSSISASVSSRATHLSQLRCRSTSHPLVLPKSQWLSPYMSGRHQSYRWRHGSAHQCVQHRFQDGLHKKGLHCWLYTVIVTAVLVHLCSQLIMSVNTRCTQ